MLAALVTALGVLAWPMLAQAHEAADEQRLPTIGAAPDFAWTSQDGAEVTGAFRGKVVAVTFIYTSCPDVCPMLTDKIARVQDELGADFGSKIAFPSISVDPEHDTPAVLREYVSRADLAGWSFLATGTPAAVREWQRPRVRGAGGGRPGGPYAADHAGLPDGIMRVQYLGYRFDEEEFRHDLLDLVNEP